jgi:hypothetical protein
MGALGFREVRTRPHRCRSSINFSRVLYDSSAARRLALASAGPSFFGKAPGSRAARVTEWRIFFDFSFQSLARNAPPIAAYRMSSLNQKRALR